MDEHESKTLFAAYGIDGPREFVVTGPGDAQRAAETLACRVAIKLLSPDVQHKSDMNLVRLGLEPGAAVADAAEQVLSTARSAGIQSPRLIVQQMIEPGVELVLGVKNDPTFGPIVLVGLGGTFTELIRDTALARAPITDTQASELLETLRGSEVLNGARGSAGVDRASVIKALVRLSELGSDYRHELEEIDINPIIAGPGGAVAVDGLVVLRGASDGRASRRLRAVVV
jgi:succinyl-CoA synthetase beta subunit